MGRILILSLMTLALMAFKPVDHFIPASSLDVGIHVAAHAQGFLKARNHSDQPNPLSFQTNKVSGILLIANMQAATPTPKPTGTPIPTPPPANPTENNMMIFFVVIAVLVVIVGVWINRQRTWRA
jgi:hypothetical protein